MRILILYGTTDGHTGKIARFLGSKLAAGGAAVDVVNVAEADPHPVDYEGVIVAASVHAGHFQPDVSRWVRAHYIPLEARPTAFLSVCLGVLQKDLGAPRELMATVERFEKAAGWTPGMVKLVAGAVPFTKYGWFKRLMMRRIVRKAGGLTDTSRDYEYTDWDDLRRFCTEFLARCNRVAPIEASKRAG